MGILGEYSEEYLARIRELEEALEFYANMLHIGDTPETVREGATVPEGFELLDLGYIENGMRARRVLGK